MMRIIYGIMVNKLEIQQDMLKQVAKGLSKEIKTLKKQLEFEKEDSKFMWRYYDGWDNSIKRIEIEINILVQQKIKHEKWHKLLKHQIQELKKPLD
jgi:hypothetical protein